MIDNTQFLAGGAPTAKQLALTGKMATYQAGAIGGNAVILAAFTEVLFSSRSLVSLGHGVFCKFAPLNRFEGHRLGQSYRPIERVFSGQ